MSRWPFEEPRKKYRYRGEPFTPRQIRQAMQRLERRLGMQRNQGRTPQRSTPPGALARLNPKLLQHKA